MKSQLYSHSDFDLPTLFGVVNEDPRNAKGLPLGFGQFYEFLKYLRISEKKLKYVPGLFEYFDTEDNEMISYKEFEAVLGFEKIQNSENLTKKEAKKKLSLKDIRQVINFH